LLCPATVDPKAPPVEFDTVYTLAGTAMHEKAEKLLKSWAGVADLSTPHMQETLHAAGTSESGQPLTVEVAPEDWHPHVVPYVQGVRELFESEVLQGHEPRMLAEERVTILGEDCWGTCDTIIMVPGEVLHIADLKTGSGHIVGARGSQFLSYAAGVCLQYGFRFKRIYMHRFQAAACRQWETEEVTAEELQNHLKELKKAITISKKGKMPTEANINDECGWCRRVWPDGSAGRAGCPAHLGRALQALIDVDAQEEKESGALTFPAPDKLPIDRLGWVLFHARAIKDWLSDVEKFANEQARKGREFLGFKMVEKSTHRKWSPKLSEADIAKEILSMAETLEKDIDPYDHKLASLTTVEKILGKGSVDHLVVRPEGERVLVREADHRPGHSILDVLGEVSDA
jgi:hypothetical protein